MQITEKLTDEQLVRAFSEGDNAAFDTLLMRHKTRIFNYIFQVVKDKAVADDLFQETFIKAIVHIKQGSYVENGKFGAWLGRVAHNLVIDYFRQEKSESEVSIDDSDNMLNRRELADASVEDMLVDSQILKDVRSLVKELPKLQREVLTMRYYRNMSFKEIAEATGVSINTALGRMRYAILNLRRLASEKNVLLEK